MGWKIQPEQQRREDQSTTDAEQPRQPAGEQAERDQNEDLPPRQHGVQSILSTSMTSDAASARLLPFLVADGHCQMALDALLLQQSERNPILRFYRWRGPWLSLGRHQRDIPDHWLALEQAGRLSLVRRPSGGGAVLHDGGLTYALIWPGAPRKRRRAYQESCQWLIEGFRSLGDTLRFGDDAAERNTGHCFARSTAADLVDQHGIKRIGSAQRWQRGCLLQHGEILLDPPEMLWWEVFGEQPPPPASANIPREGLRRVLLEALQMQWTNVHWHETPLNRAEAHVLELSDSGSPPCMASTT